MGRRFRFMGPGGQEKTPGSCRENSVGKSGAKTRTCQKWGGNPTGTWMKQPRGSKFGGEIFWVATFHVGGRDVATKGAPRNPGAPGQVVAWPEGKEILYDR